MASSSAAAGPVSGNNNSSNTAALESWALPRLQQLLPLDEASLQQVLQYALSLSPADAADHLKNLLGDDAPALEFIASLSQRRLSLLGPRGAQAQASQQQTQSASQSQRSATTPSAPSSRGGRGGRKKPNIHALPARQLQGQGNVGGGYVKSRAEEDYIPRASERQRHKETVADNLALREARPPDATQLPLVTDGGSSAAASRAPPSAAGPLVSDALAPKKKAATSSHGSRAQSPAPTKTTVSLSGGAQMRGASSALSDLDSAIRSLELQTNPSLGATPEDEARRRCACMATRHPLLDVAPNCLSCGNIVCVKQGLGPCVSCGTPLLSPDDIARVLRVLKDERGEERQRANNAAHRRPDVAHGKARALTGRDFLASAAASPRPSPLSSRPATPVSADEAASANNSDDAAATSAQAHRDKLLAFQAQNARRTTVRDEAADFEIPAAGTSMWASPAERAAQLKRQQRVLREMEWNARPEYERRRVVASIDLQGRRVVRTMAEVPKPDFGADDDDDDGDAEDNTDVMHGAATNAAAGAFSNNPLAKGLIRPLAREPKGKARDDEPDGPGPRAQESSWRRVQMDEDDNEQWILDGGVYGGRAVDAPLGAEEHAFA